MHCRAIWPFRRTVKQANAFAKDAAYCHHTWNNRTNQFQRALPPEPMLA
jgi:hypothetical protein